MEKESKDSENVSSKSTGREKKVDLYLDGPLLRLHEVQKKESTTSSHADEPSQNSEIDVNIEVHHMKVLPTCLKYRLIMVVLQ